MSQDRHTILIEAKNAASAELKKVSDDVNANAKAVNDAARAYNKSEGDIKAYERAIKGASGETSSFTNIFGGMAGKFAIGSLAAQGVTMAISELTDFMKGSAQAALDEEKQWNRMSGAIKAVGGNVDILLPKFQALTDLLEMQTGVADNLISSSFAQMTRAGLDVAKSQDLMNVALDISVDREQDLGTVTDTLIKAMAGKEGALERLAATYGIVVTKADTFETVLKRVTELSAGAAKSSMEGLTGETRRNEIEWQRAQETIGTKVVPVFTSLATTLTDVIIGIDHLGKGFGDLPAKMKISALTEEIGKLEEALKEPGIWAFLHTFENTKALDEFKEKLALARIEAHDLMMETRDTPDIPSIVAPPAPDFKSDMGLDTTDAERADQEYTDKLTAQLALRDAAQRQYRLDMQDLNSTYDTLTLEGIDLLNAQEQEKITAINANELITEQQKLEQIAGLRRNYDAMRATEQEKADKVRGDAAIKAAKTEITIATGYLKAGSDSLLAWGKSTKERMEMFGKEMAKILQNLVLEQIKAQMSSAASGVKEVAADGPVKKSNIFTSATNAAKKLPFPLNIAAAAATVAGLAYLMKGFDDPMNDREMVKWGKDIGKFAKQGFDSTEMGSGNFGKTVAGVMGSPEPAMAGGGTVINVTINGSMTPEFIKDVVSPALVKLTDVGGTRLKSHAIGSTWGFRSEMAGIYNQTGSGGGGTGGGGEQGQGSKGEVPPSA